MHLPEGGPTGTGPHAVIRQVHRQQLERQSVACRSRSLLSNESQNSAVRCMSDADNSTASEVSHPFSKALAVNTIECTS